MNVLSRKLGKAPAKKDPRTLLLASYFAPSLPAAPPRLRWSDKLGGVYPMFQNDVLGDCTAAAAGHLVRGWTANSCGLPAPITDKEVVDFYRYATGYDPADPETDRGGVMLDVLKAWRKEEGPGVGGHRLGAFAYVRPSSRSLVKHAIHLFGGLDVGVMLPVSAEGEDHWDVPNVGVTPGSDGEKGSWGGHNVAILDYDDRGLGFLSWGRRMTMTWRFLATYADEAYALLSQDFIRLGKAPNGFLLTALQQDLARLR